MSRRERLRQEKKARLHKRGALSGERRSNTDKRLAETFKSALSLQQAGRFSEAEEAWEALRYRMPDHDGINVNLATIFWRQGRIGEAAEACHRAIKTNPSSAAGFALLGAVYGAQKDHRNAISCLETAVKLKPELITAWLQLALLQRDCGDLDRALIACERAKALEPARADVQNVLGLVLQARGDWKKAERALRRAKDSSPTGQVRAEVETNLAGLLIMRESFEKAVDCCRAAINVHPNYPQAHNVLGIALKSLNDLDGAKTAFKRAIKLDPKMIEAKINLGLVFGMLGYWEKALRCYDQALEISPNSAEAFNNRGNALSSLARHNEAIESLKQAIKINKDYAEPHLNLAFELLAKGRWTEAWPEFEWRWKTTQMRRFYRSFERSQWDGSFNLTATLLVHAEQGIGDTLNFVRYLPLVATRVRRLIFECQSTLIGLLANIEGADQIVTSNDELPHFDLHVPLLSLPGIFRTTPETIPGSVPYIHVPGEVDVPLPLVGTGLKVGIVWAGNPGNPLDASRSIGLAPLKKLFGVPGCIFYSLQYGELAKEISLEGLESRVQDLSPLIDDFATTAALVDQMDLVISVCTSVAHLAGGMGVETWVLLSDDADWRWMRNRSDSPWYPSMRLFRQKNRNDWVDVVDKVAEALISHVESEGKVQRA